MRSGRLEQVQRSFSQVSPCLSVQLISAHSSLSRAVICCRIGISCRPDRCPASLGLHASSDRALTTFCYGEASLCWVEVFFLGTLFPCLVIAFDFASLSGERELQWFKHGYLVTNIYWAPLPARCCLSHSGDNGILAERKAWAKAHSLYSTCVQKNRAKSFC